MLTEIQTSYFLIITLIVIFVLNPFVKKKAMGNLDSNEFVLLNHFLMTLMIILFAIYLLYNNKYNNKYNINNLRKLSKINIFWCIISAIISFIAIVVFTRSLKKEEITFMIPSILPIVIALTTIIGYIVFNETMGKFKIIGILLIILGTIFINYDKYITK